MQTAATPAIDRASFLLVSALAPKEIGQRIQQARKENGLTQDELSEMSSFSRRALQTWESGAVIPYKHLREISRLLDVQVSWLLHGPHGEEEISAGSVDRHLEDIEVKLDRLTAIVERLALADARDGPADGRSAGNE